VNRPAGVALVAIFAVISTRLSRRAIFLLRERFADVCPSAAREEWLMQRVRSLLRAAPSRIGRRLAVILAIAAASLPEAGA
jgi:hypothetical protein